MAQEYGDQVDLVKYEADLPENAKLLEKYNVVSLPTIVLEIDGEVWGTKVGLQPEADYRTWIETHLEIAKGLSNGS